MSKLLDVEKELSEWRKSKNIDKKREIPDYLRIQIVDLLPRYTGNQIHRKLGVNSTTLKKWKKKYKKAEDFFIHIPKLSEEEIKESSKEKMLLKISRGECSIEGNLSLNEWNVAISLLEGLKK